MPFSQQNGLRYYAFEIFPENIVQAVFTRQGGVSPRPWDSLNVGGAIGDDITHVRENRIRSFRALGRVPESIHDVWQVHSADVIYADVPRPLDTPYQKADILLTDNPQVTLFMRFADCTPILLYDPKREALGIVHSGWLGTVRGAARTAVQAMQERYASNPADILAAIGPAIGPDHYEVGEDVISQVKDAFGADGESLLKAQGVSVHFDLWKANRFLLERAGVTQIETAGICTACHPDDWFSYRGEKGKTGRFGALIALKN
ncbi:MAG: peptidoglycan editing factor PgeF [Anaerolineales bacterium]|nr:peptidoglycan editing factor PgeF [Anaerolineales bacterium]